MTYLCKDCQNKGCGSYHDECEQSQEWKLFQKQCSEYLRKEKDHNRRWALKESTFKGRKRKIN